MDRRRILTRIVQVFSVVGLAGVSYPFLRNWFPAAGDGMSRDVQVGDMKPGDIRRVQWLGRTVLVLRRTLAQLQAVQQSVDELADPASAVSQQPDFARNSHRSRREEIFVAYANCTHLGCEVQTTADNPAVAFTCPCHQSEFDAAGRVMRESAATRNLEVPRYQFISRNALRLQKETT